MSKTIGQDQPDTGIILPADKVLSRAANELQHLADSADNLQSLLTRIISENNACSSNHIFELQSIDQLKQSIEDMVSFLTCLSEDSAPDWVYDVASATRRAKLMDLAARLKSVEEQTISSQEEDPGDCEMF